MSDSAFRAILERRKVIICAGSGGVGKTTTSAICGIAGGFIGKRTLILTIDPAKRLATSLGIEAVGAEPAEITPALREAGYQPKAEVWAMMLDMSNTFDQILGRFIQDPQQLDAIHKNTIYKNLSRTLSGSHEYAAMNKLADLYREGDWDLIILDTPPTTHALDFLQAPDKLNAFFKSRLVEILARNNSGKKGWSIFKRGTDLLLTSLEKLIGSGLIGQIAEFFTLVDKFLDGFEQNSGEVEKLMASDDVEFAIVCGPSPAQTEEASSFFSALKRMHIQTGALVINRRLLPVLDPKTREKLTANFDPADPHSLLAEVDLAAAHQEDSVEKAKSTLGASSLFQVPMRDRDVHSIENLIAVGEILFGNIFEK